MSLKAKLEAVIYAAEEPVTLNQLAALFAADALEWRAAREAAAAEQTAEAAGISPDAAQCLPLIVQAAESPVPAESSSDGEPGPAPGSEQSQPAAVPGEKAVATPEAAGPQANDVISIGEAEAYPPITVEGEPSPADAALFPSELADPESEARRLVRQKDREVKAVLKQLLDELIAGYQADGRGVEIREIAGGYRMATKPECHDAVRLFVKSLKPPLKLSLPALETLAVIAYKQPVTAPEVSEIRGVESVGVLGSLLARKLIATAGRKPVIGRPILYKTTKEFLLRFGLKDVSELPSMEEFEKMAATELDMEPEVAEADERAESDEAASAESLNANPNAEENLESNSPSGEELAGTAETADEPKSPVKQESGVGTSAESATAVNAGTEQPAPAASVEARSGGEQENEATSHAQESDQESRKEG